MPGDARERLAADQARLVAALSGQAAAPAGFDAARVGLAAETLVAKRRKAIARSFPRLVAALDADFKPKFDTFAKELARLRTGPPPTASPSPAGWTGGANCRPSRFPNTSTPASGLARRWGSSPVATPPAFASASACPASACGSCRSRFSPADVPVCPWSLVLCCRRK